MFDMRTYLFIEIHHKQHNNYRSLELQISKIKLLWRGKKDRHSQLPYSMVKANKNNKNRQNKFRTKIWNQNNRWKITTKCMAISRNLDKFIARSRLLNDNRLGAETISPGKEFQAGTTRAA